MNIRDNFPGNGMRPEPSDYEAKLIEKREAVEANYAALRADDALAAQYDSKLAVDIAEDLARELPDEESTLPTMVGAKRILFNRAIANERTEKAAQQAIAAAANAKVRQLTVSIRSLEDALDSLLAAEA